MKPASFEYHRPTSMDQILSLLASHGDEGKVLAGGQSLVPAMNFRLARPGVILDINALNELAYIRQEGAVLKIGALTRHANFHKPVVAGALGAMLSDVVSHIAHYPIRQRGTFGGSLAHADPASEWCLVVTVLDAEIVVRSAKGQRTVRASAFFRGTFTTDLKSDELLVEIRLPVLDAGWCTGFFEFARRAGDFALAMSLAALKIEDGRITAAHLGIGGVSDRAIRLPALEKQLLGQSPTAELFERIGKLASDVLEPTEDIHASKEYRRDLIGVVVKRALAKAVA